MSELIQVLPRRQRRMTDAFCCWTWKDEPNCVRQPLFRLATPHGHMDFCGEHIDAMIVALPREWLDGFAYREPVPVAADDDDIPF